MRFFFNKVCWIITCSSFILMVTVYKLVDYKDPRYYNKTPEAFILQPSISQSSLRTYHELPPLDSNDSTPMWEQTLDFDRLQFSNETGNPSGCYLIPNYIHFIYFGGISFQYYNMICVLAAFKNQKPEKIFFHYDNLTTFTGKYWDVLLQTPGFKDVIVRHKVEVPTEVYGQPLSKEWRLWHASDISRIRMLMKFGGIFLDNDCYLIRSVDDYRRFEISLNWDEDQLLGNQVIIAHKDARFLKKWLECYKHYDKTQWYYNAGGRPTVEVLYKQPELIHRVKMLFGTHNGFIFKLFQQKWSEWRYLHTVHLLIGHQYLLKSISEKAVYPVEFNEKNIAYYPITFRDMAYEVYDIANIKWPKIKAESKKSKIRKIKKKF